jgi:hypothetical protein
LTKQNEQKTCFTCAVDVNMIFVVKTIICTHGIYMFINTKNRINLHT